MRVLSLLILLGFFVAMPLGLLNYVVLPQLLSMKNFYQSADQTALSVSSSDR